MLEQTINIRSGHFVEVLGRRLRFFVMAFVALTLSACVPSGEQNVNTELFKNQEDMKIKAADLKPGAKKKAVFQALGIRPEKFERMSVQDVQASLYGNSQLQGNPDQLEAFKKRLMAYEGYALPYRALKSDSSLGFGKMKVNKTGYDLKLVLIFEHDKLLRASVEGTQDVNQEEDQSLWGTIITKGIGFAL